MTQPGQLDLDTDKAKEIWDEYASTHDLTGMENLAVGIDPETGEVHLGETALAIAKTLREAGRFKRLFFRRVGDPYYSHRRRRR